MLPCSSAWGYLVKCRYSHRPHCPALQLSMCVPENPHSALVGGQKANLSCLPAYNLTQCGWAKPKGSLCLDMLSTGSGLSGRLNPAESSSRCALWLPAWSVASCCYILPRCHGGCSPNPNPLPTHGQALTEGCGQQSVAMVTGYRWGRAAWRNHSREKGSW